MALFTDAQKATIYATVKADPVANALVVAGDAQGNIEYLPIINWLQAPSTFKVWRTFTQADEIQEAVNWANFTPANPLGTSTVADTNWLLACQGKQFSLQLILAVTGSFGRGISTGKPNIRAGLQDCLSNVPSGPLGAGRTGGWPVVQLAIQRFATNIEKMFATGTGTQASPATLVFEKTLYQQEALEIVDIFWGVGGVLL